MTTIRERLSSIETEVKYIKNIIYLLGVVIIGEGAMTRFII